jgi:hypothetical protein
VDVDVSTLDNGKSHKEGVGRTYMGTDGYAPIFSYIGTEEYMLGCQLRPGTQHSQKGTPEFLERNLRREPLEQWREIAETLGTARHPRPGKTVYTGTITKRKVIADLILVGCKLVQHGRQMILRIWNGNPWLPVFNELYAEFLRL